MSLGGLKTRAIMGPVRPHHLLPLALLLAACGKGNFRSGAGSTKGGGTITYPLNVKSTTIDPGKVNDYYMFELSQNVVEGLVAYDEKNELVPWLAGKWELINGGRTYLFHIRRNVKFTNGRPLVADDFRKSWERYLSPKFASPMAATYLGSIVGVKAFTEGKASSISGVKVIDDHTLRVTLDKPRPYYLGNFCVTQTTVIDTEVAGPSEVTSIDKIVGTGPFKYEKLSPDEEILLAANPTYWGGRPKIDHIRRPMVTEPAARLNRFRAGEFDFLEIGRQEGQSLSPEEAKAGNMKTEDRAVLFFLTPGLNAYAPFRNVHVRRAFALAIDRHKLVEDLLSGFPEATGLVPHGIPARVENYKGLTFDPAAARKELASAGYPDGKGLPAIELDYSLLSPEFRVIAEAVATDLQRNLNITVRPKLLEWSAYLDRRAHGKIEFGVLTWTADYLDPQNFLSLQLASTGAENKEGLSDPEVDALFAKADVETRPEVRLDLNRQSERLATEHVLRIPICMSAIPVLRSSRIKGFRTNAFGPMPLLKAEIVR